MTVNQEKINMRRKDMVQISDLARYSSTCMLYGHRSELVPCTRTVDPKKRNVQSTWALPRHMGGVRQTARCPYGAAEPSWAMVQCNSSSHPPRASQPPSNLSLESIDRLRGICAHYEPKTQTLTERECLSRVHESEIRSPQSMHANRNLNT